MSVTLAQFQTSIQSVQSRFIKVELLNYQFQTVDEISGICTSGSISIDSTADVRRTASIVLAVKDTSFEVASGARVWLDKYIRLLVGTQSMRTGEIEYVNCGIYIIDAPSYEYAPETNTVSFSLLDLMAKLTGTRNGYLKGVPVVLKAGENIRQTIIDTLALGGFTQYVVEEAPFPSVIPTDLEFNQGSTVYDLLSGLRDIYPYYEMYFDVNGTFFYKRKPTGENDPVVVDDTTFIPIVTNEKIEVDFQNVKNSIEVWGRTHDPAHYSDTAEVTDNTIKLTIADVTAYTENVVYGFTMKDNKGLTAPKLKINDLTILPIKNDDGTDTNIVAEEGDVYFCVQYKTTYWRWLGHLQAYGFVEDTNEKSPYYVNGSVGRIRLPLYDGDYANCLTDDLALQRAKYELWLHTNLNDTVTLTCVPVYWFDVNMLVEYTLNRNGEKRKYLITSIQQGLAPTDNMTVTMARYYGENEADTDYELLEYIESNGDQWIDVGFNPKQDTRVYAKVSQYPNTKEGALFGARDSADGTVHYTFRTNDKKYRTEYANVYAEFATDVNFEEQFTVDKDDNVTTLNTDKTVTIAYTGTFTCANSLYIFACNTGGKADLKTKGVRIHSLVVYDDDNAVRNFIPARHKETGEIGMYDGVELKFYKNAGTGKFIAGKVKGN
jgi:hypothetical protein